MGRQRLRMLSKQMHHGPHDVTFQVGNSQQVDDAVKLATFMADEFRVQPGRIGVGFSRAAEPDNTLRIQLSLGLPKS